MVDFEQVNIGWDTDTTFFERFPYLFNKRNFMTLEVSHGTSLFLLFCFHCLCVCLHSFLWFVLFSSKVAIFFEEQCVVTNTVKSVLQSEVRYICTGVFDPFRT